ncbi:MAG: hypothetical protein HY200_03360 [Nitrospirae bacterium]|nr:hypothetical protein [Nitrospirota bacterium]
MTKKFWNVSFWLLLLPIIGCAAANEEAYDHLSNRIEKQLDSTSGKKPSSQGLNSDRNSPRDNRPSHQTESLNLKEEESPEADNSAPPPPPISGSERKEDRKDIFTKLSPQSTVTFQNNATTSDSVTHSDGNATTPNPAPSLIVGTPSSSLIHVGEQVFLTIAINQVERLFSAPFYLMYNPNLLELVKVLQGNFLSQDHQQVLFLNSNQPEQGRIIIGLTRVGQVSGITGSGVLAIFTFKAKMSGFAKFSMEGVDFRNDAMDVIPLQAVLTDLNIE